MTSPKDAWDGRVNDELIALYEEAWDEGIFLVEWEHMAAAGRHQILEELQRQTGKPMTPDIYRNFSMLDCIQLGMRPGVGRTRVEACRKAIETLKKSEAKKAAVSAEKNQRTQTTNAEPLAKWDAEEGAERDPRLIWWSRLDKRYQVEVQRIDEDYGRLLVFDHEAENACLLDKAVKLSYGARFGPDADDVSEWQEMAATAVDKASRP